MTEEERQAKKNQKNYRKKLKAYGMSYYQIKTKVSNYYKKKCKH